jgi:hypothetical protein
MDSDPKYLERRESRIVNIFHRFTLRYPELLSFLAGWSAYPIGLALLSLLGR